MAHHFYTLMISGLFFSFFFRTPKCHQTHNCFSYSAVPVAFAVQLLLSTTRVRGWTRLHCHVSVSCQAKNVRTMRLCVVVPLSPTRWARRTSSCQWTAWDGSQSAFVRRLPAPRPTPSPSGQLRGNMGKETGREELFPCSRIRWVLEVFGGCCVLYIPRVLGGGRRRIAHQLQKTRILISTDAACLR